MRQNETVLEAVNTCLTEELLQDLRTSVGQSPAVVRPVLERLIALVVNTLQSRVARPNGVEVLWTLTQQAREAGALAQLHSPADFHGRGALLMQGLLGEAYDSITQRLAATAALPQAAFALLWEVAVAAVLGTFGQYAADHQLDAASLSWWLQQQQSITTAMPLPHDGTFPPPSPTPEAAPSESAATEKDLFHRFTVAGAGTWEKVGGGITFTPSQRAARSGKRRRWQWALLLLPVLGLGYVGSAYFLQQEPETPPLSTTPAPRATASRPATGAVATSYNGTRDAVGALAPAAPAGRYDPTTDTYIYTTGAPLVLTLPDGSRQQVGSNSTEYQLYQFLAAPGPQANTRSPGAGWINVDRVYFTPGQATLTAESQQQLRNLAGILRAFPRARIKLGGYTDSTGDEQKNLLLSQARAVAARQALGRLGVGLPRLQAVGYGAHDFVASNSGPVGRALNRRLSLQVISKAGALLPTSVPAATRAAVPLAAAAPPRASAARPHATRPAKVRRSSRRPAKRRGWFRNLLQRVRGKRNHQR